MAERSRAVSIVPQSSQAAGEAPTMQTVTVAVLAPRLPDNMGVPTGVGPSGAFAWDESVNYKHNAPYKPDDAPEEVSKFKAMRRKMGWTTQRKKATDSPPFIMREVPYDVWRKHYAKDKDGRYHGTHAPAEDCLLLEEDVAKWRIEAPKTEGDRWTRGSVVLPGYGDVQDEGAAPTYSEERDDYHLGVPPPEEPRLSGSYKRSSVDNTKSTFTADGKSAAQIIADAKARAQIKDTQRQGFKRYLDSGIAMTMGQ